ncbi:MAG: amino acid racemase [Clostridiales bacterium]|nr:amino acid racemase [Clostridiales bacterium]
MKKTVLGILGGLGPASSVYFYDLITNGTQAPGDRDHIDLVLSSHATTPDRTGFILGKKQENPLEDMVRDAKKLEAFGADFIAIPCNTAHYFYEELAEAVHIPIINIVSETAAYMHAMGVKKAGVLATDGTVQSGTYQKALSFCDIECVMPEQADQAAVMRIIYDDIKSGKKPDVVCFQKIANALFAKGCERLILGCTELSLIKKQAQLDERFVDSLEVLACRCITLCEKKPKGFAQELIDFEVHNHAAIQAFAKSGC